MIYLRIYVQKDNFQAPIKKLTCTMLLSICFDFFIKKSMNDFILRGEALSLKLGDFWYFLTLGLLHRLFI